MSCDSSLKRKHNEVSIEVKLRAIREIENGYSIYDICNDLKVHHNTVKSWLKNKEKFVKWSAERGNNKLMPRIRLSHEDNKKVNHAMWIWFQDKRKSGVPINGPMIQAQALRFNSILGGNKDFKASNGWLRSWKERHGIRALTICGEKLSANIEATDPFKEKFLKFVQDNNLSFHQVFNCDETRLNFKALPKTTLSSRLQEPPSGLKSSKEGFTVMACSNAAGSFKLPLVFIGTAARPRALKNYNNLPVTYYSQKKSWMTKQLFATWIENDFVPKVKEYLQFNGLPPKALLLMDNCSAHKINLEEHGIFIMFFPSNTTSLIQPMDQGCLQNLKLLYKKYLMDIILDCIEKNITLSDTVKSITIKHAIDWAAGAWNQVTQTCIQKSWNQVWPWNDRVNVSNFVNQEQVIYNLLQQFHTALQSLPEYRNVDVGNFEEWLKSTHQTPYLSETDIVDIIHEENGEETMSHQVEDNNPQEKKNHQVEDDNPQEKENQPMYENCEFNCHMPVEIEVSQEVTKEAAGLCFKQLKKWCYDNCFEESRDALNIIENIFQ